MSKIVTYVDGNGVTRSIAQWAADYSPAPYAYTPASANAPRTAYAVDDALAAATAADYRYPSVPSLTPTVEDYRAAMRVAQGLKLRGHTVPVVVGANTLQVPASLQYQQYLAGLAAEVASGATSVSVWFQGAAHVMTAANFKTAYTAYQASLRADGANNHLQIAAAIEAAAVAADLDAVVIV